MSLFRFFFVSVLISLTFAGEASAAANCLPIPTTNGLWNKHQCDVGGPNCADSPVPPNAPVGSASPLPYAGSFGAMANPMAACCGMGWVEDTDAGQKMDCVEAVPPAAGTYQSFLEFYNFGSAKDAITTAGLKYPNRVFVLGRDGIPLNGFYDQSGKRCRYRTPGTQSYITLSNADQMKLLDVAINTDHYAPTPLTPTTSGVAAEVDQLCCAAVIFALERKCPKEDTIGGVPVAIYYGGARRCTAAKEMKLHFGVFDLCDPKVVNRGRFRTATSYLGEDPKNVTLVKTNPVQISGLIEHFYPKPGPSPSPTSVPTPCPLSPALYELPWSGGECRLKSPEPTPTP